MQIELLSQTHRVSLITRRAATIHTRPLFEIEAPRTSSGGYVSPPSQGLDLLEAALDLSESDSKSLTLHLPQLHWCTLRKRQTAYAGSIRLTCSCVRMSLRLS
jgi:hypothetical protein